MVVEQKEKSYIRDIAIAMLTLIAIGLVLRGCEQEKKLVETNKLLVDANSELVVWKDAEGKSSAKITAMETEKAKDFLRLQSKDVDILQLQSLVRDYKSKLNKGGSISIIKTEANIDTTISTVVTIDTTQTVKEGDCPSPTYSSTFNLDNWVTGSTVATKDSTRVKVKFREQLDVIIGRDKTGFLGLGKGTPFAQVNLHNPYNEVTQIKTYSVKEPPTKYWHVGIGVFYGVGNSFEPQVILGAGLMWTPINF